MSDAGQALVIIFLVGVLVAYHKFNKYVISKRNKERELNRCMVSDVIMNDFKLLDKICDGKRWLGSESTIVDWKHQSRYELGFEQNLLCRTNKGAWFVVEYRMNYLVVDYVRVFVCDEDAAKEWISFNRDLYLSYFSEPETA